MGINISSFERLPEWKVIVMAIPCPMCSAVVDQPCRNMGAVPGTIFYDQPRVDFHAERKYNAAMRYSQIQEQANANEGQSVQGNDGSGQGVDVKQSEEEGHQAPEETPREEVVQVPIPEGMHVDEEKPGVLIRDEPSTEN